MRHITAAAAETDKIGEIAAQALAEIHAAIYGQPPQAARAWTDGDAILLVMRLLEPSTDIARSEPPLAEMQRMVAATVERRTGERLRAASTSVDPGRGLVVLAFERLRARSDEQNPGRLPAGPVRGAG